MSKTSIIHKYYSLRHMFHSRAYFTSESFILRLRMLWRLQHSFSDTAVSHAYLIHYKTTSLNSTNLKEMTEIDTFVSKIKHFNIKKRYLLLGNMRKLPSPPLSVLMTQYTLSQITFCCLLLTRTTKQAKPNLYMLAPVKVKKFMFYA